MSTRAVDFIAPTIYNGGIRAIHPGNLSEFGEMSA